MSEKRVIRWGIIGCGNVTEVKSGPGFQKAAGSALVAVMRRDAGLARDYAARHNVPKWTSDAQALVNNPDVDAVYIATPPSSHREYALLAAGAGKPVYVEKPMAKNHAECLDMIAACRAAGTRLFVAYYRRAQERFMKVKSLVDAGAIGAVRFVSVTLYQAVQPDELDPARLPWRVIPEIAGGGRFVDLASHQLDLLDFILGPIRSARGFAANQAGLYRAEDIVIASFVFESGAHGTGAWCFTAFDETDRIEIVGSRGKIKFSTFGVEPVQLTDASGTHEYAIPYPQHVQQPLIQTIVDELLGIGRCPSRGESAARTSWVMDQIREESHGPSRTDEPL